MYFVSSPQWLELLLEYEHLHDHLQIGYCITNYEYLCETAKLKSSYHHSLFPKVKELKDISTVIAHISVILQDAVNYPRDLIHSFRLKT